MPSPELHLHLNSELAAYAKFAIDSYDKNQKNAVYTLTTSGTNKTVSISDPNAANKSANASAVGGGSNAPDKTILSSTKNRARSNSVNSAKAATVNDQPVQEKSAPARAKAPKLSKDQQKAQNNKYRSDFYNAIVRHYGGKNNIPAFVKKALHLNNFSLKDNGDGTFSATSGRELKANRIMDVLKAMEKEADTDSTLFAKNLVGKLQEVKKFKYDPEDKELLLKSHVHYIFDKLFPKSYFSKVTPELYKEIVGSEPPQGKGACAKDLADKLHEKLENVVTKFGDNGNSWQETLGDILFTATLVNPNDKHAQWCEKVSNAIETISHNEEPVSIQNQFDIKKPYTSNIVTSEEVKTPQILHKEMVDFLATDRAKELAKNQKVKTLSDFNITDKKHIWQQNQFQWGCGQTAEIIKAVCEQNGISKDDLNAIGCQVFGDNRMCLGLVHCAANTQEETLTRCVDKEDMAFILNYIDVKYETNCQTETTQNDSNGKLRYIYKDGPGALNPAEGYITPARLTNSEGKKFDAIRMQLFFSAMPSMATPYINFDPRGNLFYALACRQLLSPDKKITPEQAQKALNFINELQKEAFNKPQEEKLKTRTAIPNYKEIMKLLMFSGENSEFDIFSDNPKEEIQKLINLCSEENINSGKTQKLMTKANANYESTLDSVVKKQVIMAREAGIKFFIGGPAGCGAFENDPKVIARVTAKNFVNYGGGMKYVYAQFNKQQDGDMNSIAKLFMQEFNKEFAKVQQERNDRRNVFKQENAQPAQQPASENILLQDDPNHIPAQFAEPHPVYQNPSSAQDNPVQQNDVNPNQSNVAPMGAKGNVEQQENLEGEKVQESFDKRAEGINQQANNVQNAPEVNVQNAPDEPVVKTTVITLDEIEDFPKTAITALRDSIKGIASSHLTAEEKVNLMHTYLEQTMQSIFLQDEMGSNEKYKARITLELRDLNSIAKDFAVNANSNYAKRDLVQLFDNCTNLWLAAKTGDATQYSALMGFRALLRDSD